MVRTSGRCTISSVFIATTQPSSAPPMVEIWPKPSWCSQPPHFSEISTQAIGYIPPEMPLPVTMMSGSTPYFMQPHISPVRIRPV